MNQKAIFKIISKIIFLCLFLARPDALNTDNREDAFLLRTGDIIEGQVIGIEQNIAFIKTKSSDMQYVPLYLFTPKAREYIKKIAPEKPTAVLTAIMENQATLPEYDSGPYEADFIEIFSFGEIIRAKEEADKRPVLIYVDPKETLLEAMKEQLSTDPLFRSEMSWVNKKSFTRGNPDLFRTISRQFNIQTPAFLILQKDQPNIGISGMDTLQELLDTIEDYGLKAEAGEAETETEPKDI